MPLLDENLNKVGLWHGTVIKMRDGKRFKITKLNPVNVKMMAPDGRDGYTLNRDYAATIIDPDQSWDGPAEKTEYAKHLERIDKGVTLGTVVELTGPRLRKYAGDKYVCIALPSDGTMRLAKLGGAGGQYLRGITAAEVEVVNV